MKLFAHARGNWVAHFRRRELCGENGPIRQIVNGEKARRRGKQRNGRRPISASCAPGNRKEQFLTGPAKMGLRRRLDFLLGLEQERGRRNYSFVIAAQGKSYDPQIAIR